MIWHKRFFGAAGLFFAMASGGVDGQELQLKESDILKLIPVLRAAAADLGSAQAVLEREEAARTSFSGDPLQFFRNRAKFDLPQGVKYVAACSGAASVKGPVAIFTFGRSIDCYDRAWRDVWRGVKRGPDEKLPTEPTISPACRAEHEQTIKLLNDNQGVLEKRGYQFVSTGPGGFPIYLDSPGQVFRVDLELRNTYDRANPPDVHPLHNLIESEQEREKALVACSDMPSGPIVVVHPGDRFFEKEPLNALGVALRQAGLSQEQFEALKMSLFMARMDANPEMIQAAAAESDPAALRALAIRRANANLYRKFAAELNPLLDALVPK
jgi:hypothetical protein